MRAVIEEGHKRCDTAESCCLEALERFDGLTLRTRGRAH